MLHADSIRISVLIAVLLPSACDSESASRIPVSETPESFLADAASSRRLQAGFLIVDGVYNTELTAPYDVLEHSAYHVREGLGIDVFTVSPTGDAVTTAEGLKILPDYSFDTAPAIDILVVASAEGSRDSNLENRELIDWVRKRGRQAHIVMSLCWGAFVLAEADLLDGRTGTTFPGDYGTLARRFPEIDLLVNVGFVHDGHAITSQGGARSFDAAMYLVELLYGPEAARGVGGGLLIPWPPQPQSGITYHVAHGAAGPQRGSRVRSD
jgi:transcriptional regulator GlxA family with amidase domain